MSKTYEDLPVKAVRDEDQGLYLFSVNLDGADVPIASAKIGHVDTQIENAREAAAASGPVSGPEAS